MPAVGVDDQRVAADETYLVHLPRDDSSVRRAATGCGQDARCGRNALDVLGGGAAAYQDHRTAVLRKLSGARRVEHDGPDRHADAGGDRPAKRARRRRGDDAQATELLHIDTCQALACRCRIEQAFVDLVRRDPKRRPRRALAIARLQDMEAPVFYGKFKFLHVAEFAFELCRNADDFCHHLRQHLREALAIRHAIAPRHDVLPLRVEQEVEVELGLTAGRIARKCDARARGPAGIAVHHALYGDSRSQVIGQPIHFAIRHSLLACPGAPNADYRGLELVERILRKRIADEFLVQFKIVVGQCL